MVSILQKNTATRKPDNELKKRIDFVEETKKKKKKEGPSWFEKTFNKISNEIFSDDDMK